MKKPNYLVTGTSLAVMVLVVASLWWLFGRTSPPKENPYNQEFTELGQNVVQYYLRQPNQSFIVGRENKSFTQLNLAARDTLLSIKETPAEMLQKNQAGEVIPVTFDQKQIEEIEKKGIVLTGWLSQAQKFSTRMQGSQKTRNDKYNNRVLELDRFMIVLGGKDMGLIFIRNTQLGTWTCWKSDGIGINKLIDLVRAGGI